MLYRFFLAISSSTSCRSTTLIQTVLFIRTTSVLVTAEARHCSIVERSKPSSSTAIVLHQIYITLCRQSFNPPQSNPSSTTAQKHTMGFISSVTRRIRMNKLSRRLSTSTPSRSSSDGNDLIKIASAATSDTDSHASSSTFVRHNLEPVLPIDSSAQYQRLTPADLNLQSLFDNAEVLEPSTNRAIRALSTPEYPILKLDTVQSPLDTPSTKTLQAPIETSGGKLGSDTRANGNLRHHLHEEEKDGLANIDVKVPGSEGGSGSRLKRSMTGLLRRTSKKIPRSSLSLKGLRAPLSPTWRGRASIVQDDGLLKGTAEEKWLEANGLLSVGANPRVWGIGRPGY